MSLISKAWSAVSRMDSWLNLATALGTGNDKATQYGVSYDGFLDVMMLEALWRSSDLARRIVGALPDRALKQGFGFASASGDVDPQKAQDDAEELLEACDKFRVRERLGEAMTWGRLYGLGGVVLGVEGGGAPWEPLDDEAAKRLMWLMVVDARELVPNTYYDDPNEDKFGEVETYRITPVSATGLAVYNTGTAGSVIHETRIERFGGTVTSRRERIQNRGCDYSVLQSVYPVLQQVEQNWNGVCHLMTDISQGVFKINGLMQMLATGNESMMTQRMQMVQTGRSVARSIVLDADKEDFTRVATPLAGVPEVLEQSWKRLAAAAEMPLTVLMGVSPAGLNATGESDMRLWYDTIQTQREHVLAPRIQRIVRLISKTLGHAEPDAWKITWPSLWQMTAPEKADYRLKTAQADKVYIDSGVLLPEETALARFGTGQFDGDNTKIDVEARQAAMKHAIEELTAPPPPVLPGAPGGVGAPRAQPGTPAPKELMEPAKPGA